MAIQRVRAIVAGGETSCAAFFFQSRFILSTAEERCEGEARRPSSGLVIPHQRQEQ